VTLSLSKSILAEGKIKVPDGTTACKSHKAVKLQHQQNGGWKTIQKTFTNNSGGYSAHLPDKHGKWRAHLPKVTLANTTVCSAATSPVRTHN